MIIGLQQRVAEVVLEVGGNQIVDLFLNHDGIEQVDYFRLRESSPDAWYVCNRKMQMTFVNGSGRLVLFDARPKSESFGAVQQILGGAQKPVIVTIPEGIAFGRQALENSCTWICATARDSEVKKRYSLDTTLIPFAW